MAFIAGDHDIYIDPVSHERVQPGRGTPKSFYNGTMYHFANVVDKSTFDDDPELWVSTPHASMNSANIRVEDE